MSLSPSRIIVRANAARAAGEAAFSVGFERKPLDCDTFEALTAGIEVASQDWNGIAHAWLRGWDAANLAAPIPGN